MLTPDLLHDYQKKAVNFQCMHPASMLWLDMGLGKTVITLTSIAHLIRSEFLRGVVIVAPIRVVRLVWRQEAEKWEHTKHLKFSVVAGTKDQRVRALLRPADVYLINYENLGWLAETLHTYFVSKKKPVPFNGIVWDEISKMKNSATNRVKSFRKIENQFDWRTGLTGTPASNGYKDLHGQYLVIDRGDRLGTSKTQFRSRFYRKVGPYKEVPYEDTEDTIKKLIGDITLEMSAEDYNPLPDLMVNDVEIEMPPELRAKYDQMERELFVQLDSGKEIEVFNQAALTNKCLQFANGAMYPIAGMPLWEPVHTLKLEALEDILDEAQGSPVLCAYAYRSDAQRIMERFAHLDPINLTECKSEGALQNAMHRWKTGDCPLMIGHPACLHPETQVLTEWRGWVRIVDVMRDERVFDGVEFVKHDGCHYSGYKEVIELFGITMTPDHKLLIQGEWREARNVQDTRDNRLQALFKWETTSYCEGGLRRMQNGTSNAPAKCDQIESRIAQVLRQVRQRYFSSNDEHQNMVHLARNEMEGTERIGQKLRRSRDNYLRRMAKFYEFLQRHGVNLLGRTDNRKNRCEQALQQGKLQMGYEHGAAEQQAQQSVFDIPGRTTTSCRIMSSNWIFKNDAYDEIEQRNDCRRSGGRLLPVNLWEKSKEREYQATRKTHVFDLVNCGPRHRFLIRNQEGEMFISHNSMGHGIDGLQKNGHILVWFGLNWSLDLYEQFNARVRRQGQGVPVICHRILMQNTLDQAQAMALDDKATTQTALRNAVKEYRMRKEVK